MEVNTLSRGNGNARHTIGHIALSQIYNNGSNKPRRYVYPKINAPITEAIDNLPDFPRPTTTRVYTYRANSKLPVDKTNYRKMDPVLLNLSILPENKRFEYIKECFSRMHPLIKLKLNETLFKQLRSDILPFILSKNYKILGARFVYDKGKGFYMGYYDRKTESYLSLITNEKCVALESTLHINPFTKFQLSPLVECLDKSSSRGINAGQQQAKARLS